MAKPTSREQLINYALRALGAPVIEINIDCDQMEDRVDDALQFYQEYHSDAVTRNYRKHLVTATDVTNGYITLPESMLFVNNILPSSGGSSSGWTSLEYQLRHNDIWNMKDGFDMVSYEITKQHLALVDLKVNGMTEAVNFSRHMNQISIEGDNKLIEGQYIIVEGYEVLDPETFTDIYNDILLKRYVIALFKRQWGFNLRKYEGMTLPGGVTINAAQYVDEASGDIEKIEEEMQLKYALPVDFYTG